MSITRVVLTYKWRRLTAELSWLAVLAAFGASGLYAQARGGQDSARKPAADSVARDALPRRLRGVTLNHAAGLPIPNAQVFLQHHGSADTPEEAKRSGTLLRVVADAFGHFEYLNPPIGVTTLILECPGSTFSQSIGLDLRVANVRQGADTTIELVAPDIRPCWPPQRFYPLSAGKAESTRAKNSSVPNAEEASVYRTVLKTILAPRDLERTRLGLAYKTVTPCEHVKTCGVAQFPRLLALGVLDSFTVSDFTGKSANPVVLRNDFVRSLRFDPITPEDLTFLHEEVEARARSSRSDESTTEQFWDGFDSAYPRSVGLVSFTRIGFNRLYSLALVEVRLDKSGWTDKPELLLLSSTSGKWRVVRRHIEAERTTGIIANGKCIPSSGVFTVEQRPLQSIEGLYRFSFRTDLGTIKIPERMLLFVPDSVLRTEVRAVKTYPGRGFHASDPFPSSFGVPSFELLTSNGKRDEGTEFGITLLSGRIPFDRFRPAFNPDGVIGKGEDIEVLSVGPDWLGGNWVENDFRQGDGPFLHSQGHFCAQKIEAYRDSLRN